MNMKRRICSILIAAAGIALLTACQNGGGGESSHVIPHAGGSRAESSEATPQSDAARAANDLYNAASFTLLDMQNSGISLTLLSGDYTFRGSDCAEKAFLTSASSEMDALNCLQGGMKSYYDKLPELDEVAVHIVNGKCTATASGSNGVYACYPKSGDGASYGTLKDALAAGIENAK